MFTLADPAAGAQVLGLACATADELEVEGEVKGELIGTDCEIRVDLATKLGVPGLPPLVVRLSASNDVLTVRMRRRSRAIPGGQSANRIRRPGRPSATRTSTDALHEKHSPEDGQAAARDSQGE